MENYTKHFLDRGIKEFSIDGAMNAEHWANSDIRILYVLKENYGYQGCGVFRVADEAHQWLDDKIPTYKKIVLLSAAINSAKIKKRPLSSDEIKAIGHDINTLHKTLDTIAVVNIKKHSGVSRSSDAEIRRESHKNSLILKDQITELAPNIIIAGSTVCWHSLTHDLGLFEKAKDCPKSEAVVCDNTVLYHANHPSAWANGGFDVESIHRAVFSNL